MREPGAAHAPVRGKLGAVRADGELPERQHFQSIAGHWSGEPGPLFHVMGGRDLTLPNSAICNNRSVITEKPDGWKAGPSRPASREMAGQTVWIKH